MKLRSYALSIIVLATALVAGLVSSGPAKAAATSVGPTITWVADDPAVPSTTGNLSGVVNSARRMDITVAAGSGGAVDVSGCATVCTNMWFTSPNSDVSGKTFPATLEPDGSFGGDYFPSDFTSVTDGSVTMVAHVQDLATPPNLTQQGMIFTKSSDVTAPSFVSVSPADGSSVTEPSPNDGSLTINLAFHDAVGITQFHFSDDGGHTFSANLMPNPGDGTTYWYVGILQLEEGPVQYAVKAIDAAGNAQVERFSYDVVHLTAPAFDSVPFPAYTGALNTFTAATSVGGATASGNPMPDPAAITYQWRTCDEVAGFCVDDAAAASPVVHFFQPNELGRAVFMITRAPGTFGFPAAENVEFLGYVTTRPGFQAPAVAAPSAPAPAAPAVTPPGVVLTPPVVVSPVFDPDAPTTIAHGGAQAQVLTTGAGADHVATGSGNDKISTGAGDDVIAPGSGHDLINAGAGNDIVYAQHGKDVVDCGSGRDTVYANQSTVLRNCESVFVASNNHWVKVRIGPNGRPIMPRGFIGAYHKS